MKGSLRVSSNKREVLHGSWVVGVLCMAMAVLLSGTNAAAQPGKGKGAVKEGALRKELEAAYTSLFNALKKKDFDAAVAGIFAPPGAFDEESRENFAELAKDLLDTMPELSKTKFVAVKAQGDDLAGYYCLFREGEFWSVALHTFVKAEGRWKWVPGGNCSSFPAKAGEDVLAKARQLVETSEVLSLKPPELEEEPTVPRGSEPRGVINCMAYEYEMKIAINGAPLKFAGGKSFSGVLFETPAGGQPADPAVLRMGENQITVEYRKTPGKGGPGLSLEIIAFPDRPSFKLLTATKPQGKVTARFLVPADPKERIRPMEIDDDKQ